MNNLEFDSAIGFAIGEGLKSGCNGHLMLASLELHAHQLKNLIISAAQAQQDGPAIVPANGIRFRRPGTGG